MLNIATAGILLLLLIAGAAVHLFDIPLDLSEQGPVEIGQTLIVAVAAIIWARLAWRLWRPRIGEIGPVHVSLAIFFTAVCLIVVGREASWGEVYGASEAVEETLELVLGGALGLVLVAIAGWWLTGVARRQRLFRKFVRHPAFFWAILSFLLVLSGDIFEKRIFALSSNLLWEELLELMGFVAIAAAGLAGLADLRARRG